MCVTLTFEICSLPTSVHHKVFGGYLMRLAYEVIVSPHFVMSILNFIKLGFTNASMFTRGPVRFLSLDGISFARPVSIGSILRLTSYILHTNNFSQPQPIQSLVVSPQL